MRKFIVLMTISLLFSGSTWAQENQTLNTEAPVVYIYYYQYVSKDGGARFNMWINHPNIHIKNTAPGLSVGYSVGSGAGAYIEMTSTNDYNLMFFVENYEKGDMNFPLHVQVYFGGSRSNDIHIRLPEGYTAKVYASSIQER